MPKKLKKTRSSNQAPLTELLRLPTGAVDWDSLDARATPGYPAQDLRGKKRKKDAAARTRQLAPELSDLQERIYAAGRSEPAAAPSVLVLLQGMDTSGKGGVIRHAIGLVDPQGVQLTAFKQPTAEERRHDFLWRIRRALPDPGMIGIFDRSHYEDVLVARVHELVTPDVWRQRFAEINQFERELAARGTTLIKCFLNVSYEEQGERLSERLDRPDKHWKYNPGDIDDRLRWDEFRAAYGDALRRCNTKGAPWYVIPSDRKWYRNWAVATLLVEHLRRSAPDWPEADFDVSAEKARLAET